MAKFVTEVNMNGADVAHMKGAEVVYKLPIPAKVEFATNDGVCATKEGSVPYVAGRDVIMTGPGGEQWPIPISKFKETYEPVDGQEMGENGNYSKAKVEVWAVQMDKSFTVTVDWQDVPLHGAKGDYLVQYGSNDYGVVGKDIFNNTYAKVEIPEGYVSIQGLAKEDVVAALYNGARAQGMGFMAYDPTPMGRKEAAQVLAQSNKYFDYLKGRVMKVDLSGDSFDPWGYDRDNGQGAAKRIIDELRATTKTNTPAIREIHAAGIAAAAREATRD